MDQRTLEDYFRSVKESLSQHRTHLVDRLCSFTTSLHCQLSVAREQTREAKRCLAEDFNIFDFIQPDENRLSDIVAWLLDPSETHGQGDTFLREFANQLGIKVNQSLDTARVYREETTTFLPNPLRRIDILIDFGRFGIGIENKPWALEQENQVFDYLIQLERKYVSSWVLVYLSGNGSPPDSVCVDELRQKEARGCFHLMPYSTGLSTWLQSCHQVCHADRVRIFLADFVAYVGRHFTLATTARRRLN